MALTVLVRFFAGARAAAGVAEDKLELPDGATVASVAAEIAARDLLDSTRAVAPLRPPPDAAIIATDSLSAEAVAETICRQVEESRE